MHKLIYVDHLNFIISSFSIRTWDGDMVSAISNNFIKHKKSDPKNRCCTRRNSF